MDGVTDIEQAALAEAERRWTSDYLTSGSNSRRQRDFAAGASWLAEYLLSDEAVERAALKIEGIDNPDGFYEYPYTKADRARLLARSRAALSAALGFIRER